MIPCKTYAVLSALMISLSSWGASDLPPCPDSLSLSQAQQAYKSEDYYRAHEIYTQMLEGAELESNRSCQSYLYLRLGKVYNRLSVYQQAITSFHTYLDLIGQDQFTKDRAAALSGIAQAEAKLGNYERAHAAELKALRTGELLQDTSIITRSLYQLGSLFFEQQNLDMALEYYLQVMELALLSGNQRQQMSILGAIGSLYTAKGDLEKAKAYLHKTLELAEKLQRGASLAYALSNLGSVHAQMGEIEIALSYFYQSLQRRESIGDQGGMITDKYNIAQIYYGEQEMEKAEKTLLEARQLAEAINAGSKLVEIYSLLAKIYEDQGQYEKTIAYLKQFNELKDAIYDEETARMIHDKQVVYDLEKREIEINRLKEKEARLEQLQINDRLKLTLVAVGLILMGLIAIITFLFNRKLSSINASLRKSSRRIEEQNAQLEKYNHELESFAYVASHDLKQPLRTINSFTNLLERRYLDQLDDTAKEYMEFINSGVARMKILLDDLLNYSRVDQTSAKVIQISSKTALEEALLNLQSDIEAKQAEIRLTEENYPVLEVVPSQIVQVFQNLISNAIKFSNGRQPVVNISHRDQSADWTIFSVTDNGIGIDPEYKDKVFEMFTRLHHQTDYQGTGIGLATCKKIVERYGGEIWLESTPGQGTTFYFTLPKIKKVAPVE